MLDFFPKTTARDVFRKFMIYFPVGLVAVLMAFWMIARLENQRMSLMVENQERSNLRQVQHVIGHHLAMLAADLMILAENDSLKRYLESPSPSSLNGLADRFRSFIEDRNNYDRVAFLDQTGRELAGKNRLDRATEDDLQQGNYRDHVQETLTLGKGDIAVSVSIDGGKGGKEQPQTPVLSLSTPIFDTSGQRRGLVMLDCRTSQIVDLLSEIFPERDSGRLLVVDNNGYHLKISATEQDRGLSFTADRSDLWRSMQDRPSGQLLTEDGLFTFAKLLPAMEIRKATGGWREKEKENDMISLADNHAWHLISFAPVSVLSSARLFRQGSHSFWLIPLGLAALVAGSLHLAINRAKKERSDRAVELLSTAIEQSPAAALITDKTGLIQYANPKFLAMSGYAREEIVGQNPRVFKSGETPGEVYRDLWQTLRAGRVWTGEFLNKRKDKTHYIVAAKISPILTESGAISGYLAIQEDITETRRLQQQLERLATIDGLTGTYNRSHFLHLFSQELRREERYGLPLCLLIFDLDHFKAINDNYGHQTGDRVLEDFARVVSSTLRDTDIFGRLGGEEFGVVLLQTDHEGANLLAERLRTAVEKMLVTCEGHVIQVTVSIGGTQWERSDRKIEAILNRADNALYEAKRRGRNQVYFRFVTEGRDEN